MKNKKGIKVPKFTATPYIEFFDVYFRTAIRVQCELAQWCITHNSMFPITKETDECNCCLYKPDCRLCTTVKFTNPSSDEDFEVYLSNYHSDKGYRVVARFKKMHSIHIEDILSSHFVTDEFFIKRIKYVVDFESKKQKDLLELISESIDLKFNSTVFENIHAYVETCESAESKEPIVRLNIVANYSDKMGTGKFIDTISEISNVLSHIRFSTFDQDVFLRTLMNKCMQITDSQMESLKKQLQDTKNINDLRKIASRYVDSRCFKFHPLQSSFIKGVIGKKFGNNLPSYETKKVVFNTEPDIIPELEFYLPI